MPYPFGMFSDPMHAFTPSERRNIAIYVMGIMLYKFGLEAFNGSIIALATNRYDELEYTSGGMSKTFERIGLLTGLNQACQCIGSILIAPLVKQYATKNVLSWAILVFGIMSSLLLVLEAATGGRILSGGHAGSTTHPHRDLSHYGKYKTDGMIPIYCVCGIAYGMVELIRRVIPRDLVGPNFKNLQRLDALVHVLYEAAGISGSLTTGLVLIPRLGHNFSFVVTPICFILAAATWSFIREDRFQNRKAGFVMLGRQPTYCRAVLAGFRLFFESVWTGARTIFSHRRFIWLLPGYAVALYAHRYLENGVAPVLARRYLGNSAWAMIIVAGSDIGELLGALFVFIFTNLVHTPIPWLRFDALMLAVIWYLPSLTPHKGDIKYAWLLAASFFPIGFGWAAGDVSLSAYIQASLSRSQNSSANVSTLGAVMAFLYCTYIGTYAIASPVLGSHFDYISDMHYQHIQEAMLHIVGYQYTVILCLILVATFIPKGAFALNPKMLSDIDSSRRGEDIDKGESSPESGGDLDDGVEMRSMGNIH